MAGRHVIPRVHVEGMETTKDLLSKLIKRPAVAAISDCLLLALFALHPAPAISHEELAVCAASNCSDHTSLRRDPNPG
jgi:hypothetical protein